MNTKEWLDWIDRRFENLMTRPQMWVGGGVEYLQTLEIVCYDLMEIRGLAIGLPEHYDLGRKYHDLCHKKHKVYALWGFNHKVSSEMEFIISMREFWTEICKWQDELLEANLSKYTEATPRSIRAMYGLDRDFSGNPEGS